MRPVGLLVAAVAAAIFVSAFATAPIAPHVSIVAAANSQVLIALPGYDVDGDKLVATISSLPAVGTLFQLSQVFSDYGYEPKAGVPVALNTAVTGSRNRIVYAPPVNTNEPTHKWAWFTYTVSDGVSVSEPGIVWILPPARVVESSDFSSNLEGWLIADNGARAAAATAGGLSYEPYGRGLLNHYVQGTDQEIHVNRRTSDDDTRWYFIAPAKFLGNHAITYGGRLEFSMASAAGDFAAAKLNSKAAVVVLDCATCNSGSGVRLAVFAGPALVTDGTAKRISLTLDETHWLKDPKNSLVQWSAPTKCEMVEVLSGLTGVKILGDQTRWYESIALDDVAYIAGGGVPIECASIYY